MPDNRKLRDDKLTNHAKTNRFQQTNAEQLLWQALRNKQLQNHKFRRQHPIGPYIADFYCPKAKLIIEVDGPTHEHRESYDHNRTQQLTKDGYKTIRFTNDQVLNQLPIVTAQILKHLRANSPLP